MEKERQNMPNTLLLGTDGSTGAQAALDLAIRIAQHLDMQVVLVHVSTLPISLAADMMPVPEEIPSYLENVGTHILKKGKEALDQAGVSCETVLLQGAPASALLNEAKKRNVSMIVIGHRGVSALERIFMGSVADRIVHKATVPVLLAPEPEENTAHLDISRVMVATDGSENAKAAILEASKLAKAFQSKLYTIHIVSPPYALAPIPLDEDYGQLLSEAAKAVLDSASETLNDLGVAHEQVIVEGSPATQIVQEATNREVDILVIGGRGVSLIERFFLGSVADRIAHAAPCPVLVIPHD